MKFICLVWVGACFLAQPPARATEPLVPSSAAVALKSASPAPFVVGFEFKAVHPEDVDCAKAVLTAFGGPKATFRVTVTEVGGGAAEMKLALSKQVAAVDRSVDRVAERLGECSCCREASSYTWSVQRKLQ